MFDCVSAANSELSLADLLTFWTGADCIPPNGFGAVLQIQFYPQHHSERRLPSASTCALILWLPRGIDDPDTLWGLLTDAVKLSAGFGKI